MREAALLFIILMVGSVSNDAPLPPGKMIVHERDLPKYSPAGHTDTVNVRLGDREVTDAYEMIQGTMAPGAVSDTHQSAEKRSQHNDDSRQT